MRLLRTILVTCCLSFLCSAARADATVELLTIEPGDAMWARYGHTALRVREGGRDVVFNYGAAPFLKPSFLWASMRGRADFFVIVEPFGRAFERYFRLDRTLVSQELRLPPEQKRWLVEHLFHVVQPPHNTYRYDQLYDNCATRVRDVIDTASKGALRRVAAKHNPARNFRDDTLRMPPATRPPRSAGQGAYIARRSAQGLNKRGSSHEGDGRAAWQSR